MTEYRRFLLKQIGIFKSELDYSDWVIISNNGELTVEFIREFEKEIYWSYLFLKQKIEDDLLIEFDHRIDWTFYFVSTNSTYYIIKKYITRCDYGYLDQVKLSHFTTHQKQEIQRMIDLKIVFLKTR